MQESFFDPIADEAVGFFDLAIGLWVGDPGICDVDVDAIAEVLELLQGEVRAVVSGDAMRHPKPVDNGLEELDSGGTSLVSDGHGLDPLGEIVDCEQEEDVA